MNFFKSFSKTFLFTLLSSSLITPVFANPSPKDAYWYGYSWGGMHAACLAYKFNQMSKKDAKQNVNISLKVGKKHIKDDQVFKSLKNLQAQVFPEDCKGLM